MHTRQVPVVLSLSHIFSPKVFYLFSGFVDTEFLKCEGVREKDYF